MEVMVHVLFRAERQLSKKVNKVIEMGTVVVNFETHDGNIPCLLP
jgi:hypothetical protein